MAAIPVKIYEPASPPPATAGAYALSGGSPSFSARAVGRTGGISSAVLRESLTNFLANFGQALAGVPVAVAGYHVEQIELSLDVSADGNVSLIIGSADLQDRAGVKLTLRRS